MKPIEQIHRDLRACGMVQNVGEDGMQGFVTYCEPHRNFRMLFIASWGEGWEHVSVSGKRACPPWEAMCFVKDLFWLPTETVLQYHPSQDRYVNNHPYCLHLWRPLRQEIPLPPTILVGVR